ncbi:hypothetical protein B0T20DRAFT_212394 [Sordaria brevicollis]|uniref:FHA domain-containing protein n=1 Tax=Sordaria brevicollis TaxID=83679 RepID=A0AAE0UCD1_SORBR|nr:hypothetical protein B0T20DRAFT_212394 [Sordaria brevicollis]
MDSKKPAPSLLDDDFDSFSFSSFITGYTPSTTRTLSSQHPSQHQISGDLQSLYQPYEALASPFHPILDPGSVTQTQPQYRQTEHQQQPRHQPKQLSCVTKETLSQDCAQARFIVWAAVNRNLCPTLKDEERSQCPLFKCQLLLSDHQSMLKHLINCRYLSTGEYWCPQHERVERFDDVKCKRCLDHPSKRRKMLFMAKKFFHGLGHKSKKNKDPGFDINHEFSAPPPYDSLTVAPINQPMSMHTGATELESVTRYEIDSVEVPFVHQHSETGPEASVNPQALMVPAPSVVLTMPETLPGIPEMAEPAELECTEPPHLLQPTYQNPMIMNWESSGASLPVSPFACTLSDTASGRSSQSRPSLQVNTQGLQGQGMQGRRHPPRPVSRPPAASSRSHGLSPQSSVRSNASADTIFTTMSSTLVSPVTDYSEGLSSDLGSSVNNTMMADELDKVFGAICPQPFPNMFDGMAELPAELPVPQITDNLLFYMEMPSNDSKYPAQLDVTADDLMDVDQPDEIEVQHDNICHSEVERMIMSCWDLIQEHISWSRCAIQDIPANPLVNQLIMIPTKEIALTGLRTLRRMLQGEQPSSAMDIVCLIHIIYAFNLVTREDDMVQDAKELYLQCLSYANILPDNERDAYSQLVNQILRPTGITDYDFVSFGAKSPVASLSRSSSLKGKAPTTRVDLSSPDSDALLVAGCRFLDELESCIFLGQTSHSLDIHDSELRKKHQEVLMFSGNQAFSSDVTKMMCELVKHNEDLQPLKEKLWEICNQANSGTILSGRRLEIEVLHAGKEIMPASRFYRNYAPKVWELCDEIYTKYFGSVNDRAVYHQLGISVIESMIAGFKDPTNNPAMTTTEENPDELARFIQEHTDIGKPSMNTVHNRKLSVPTMTLTPPETLVYTSHVASPTAGATATAPFEPQQRQHQRQKSSLSQSLIPSEQQTPATAQKVEPDPQVIPQCHLCEYRPNGDPRWYKGSMAKHMKVKHSAEPDKIYACTYPGCKSRYTNRPDNLRQHKIEKGHWVEGEEGFFGERRPSKKRKKGNDTGEEEGL